MVSCRAACCVVLLSLPSAAHAADEKVQAALARPIVGADLPLAEVEAFCDARVPVLQPVSSRDEWSRQAEHLRRTVLRDVVFRGEARGWRDARTRVQWLESVTVADAYRIRKLRYEALPGLWIPALLYEPLKLDGKVPVVMNVNGHDGKGKAAEYKQVRCINQVRRGMLALNVEWLGMGQLRTDGFRHYRMNQLDLCGTSGLAPFYLAMKRGLDVLLAHKAADPQRVAVAGLSGGGWQTILISALDTRVTLCNPVAGYSSYRTRIRNHSDLGDSEQTPSDLATVVDYTHLTAMRAPRPTLLTYNVKDNCCFASGHALPPLLDAAAPVFSLYEAKERLRSHVNHDPGTHNFDQDNRQQLYRMLGDHFFADDTEFVSEEIPCSMELRSAADLKVDLPQGNADFNSLARDISERLPIESLPATPTRQWQQRSAQRLREITRLPEYGVTGVPDGQEEHDGLNVTFWRLRMDDVWTVPAVQFSRNADDQVVSIVLADQGRAEVGPVVDRLLTDGGVIAIDPFYLGESRIRSRDFLFALLVAAVGQRPLGLQAGQVTAVARWLKKKRAGVRVRVVAVGERSAVAALVAGAVSSSIDAVEVSESLGSLRQVIANNDSVDKKPELFCFGLLREFDIDRFVAITAPRPVRFVEPDESVRQAMAPIRKWYAAFGSDFNPLGP